MYLDVTLHTLEKKRRFALPIFPSFAVLITVNSHGVVERNQLIYPLIPGGDQQTVCFVKYVERERERERLVRKLIYVIQREAFKLNFFKDTLVGVNRLNEMKVKEVLDDDEDEISRKLLKGACQLLFS